jgi:ATP-dependent 26S proteasome regulatory subunit
VLNFLDGVDQVDKVLFLATTNYPERLSARILDRPSRLDRRHKIDYPDPEARRMYLRHLIGGEMREDRRINLDRWLQDTDQFSLAHLKELFVAVVALGDDYAEALETLRAMRERISPEEDYESPMGYTAFRRPAARGCVQ